MNVCFWKKSQFEFLNSLIALQSINQSINHIDHRNLRIYCNSKVVCSYRPSKNLVNKCKILWSTIIINLWFCFVLSTKFFFD